MFLLFFSFSTAAALLFQSLVLPMMGSVHHGHGLLQGDSAYFHSVASELAARIRSEGWSAWSLYPAQGATGNVALLAALYVVFGNTPSLMVPVNAAIHALSGVLILWLGRTVFPGRVGTIGGILAAVLFVAFPSALNWYGQIHKDGFAIAGTALLLTAWFWAERRILTSRVAGMAIALWLCGCGLIVFVRPYGLRILLVGVLAMLAIHLGAWLIRRPTGGAGRLLVLRLSLVGLMFAAIALAPRSTTDGDIAYSHWSSRASGDQVAKAYASYLNVSVDEVLLRLQSFRELVERWEWAPSPWLPQALDRYAENAAKTRVGLIESGLIMQAASMYDTDRLPASSGEMLAYLPRALQVALFSPFPQYWLEKLSAPRLIALGETLIWYVLAPGVLLLLWYRRSSAVLALLVFSLVLLAIYGATIANIGTLYRVRYFFLFLLVLLGILGWLRWFESRGWLDRGSQLDTASKASAPPTLAKQEVLQARTGLVNSGVIVAAVTAVSYLGLFCRDVLMARMFGLGSELDAFVAGAVIPMFLVSVISVPIGTAIVPIFLAERERSSPMAARALVRRIALSFVAAACVLATVVAVVGPALLELAGWSMVPEKAALTHDVTLWMLVIFILSGLVTIANGMLNALGHYVIPAAAQAIVPVVVILALVMAGREYGVVVAAMAMLAGQLLNLVLVYRALSRSGESILHLSDESGLGWGGFLQQYLPLMVAALFMQMGPPIGTAMASVLPEGSVAALGLGSKGVLFITGLIGAAITSVVLPYFSTHMAQNRLLDARRELSFLLLAGTIISIPISLVLNLLSSTFVRLLFQGGAFGVAESELVSRVMEYGVLQLPFFVVNILLLKFAIASRRSGRVMFASMIGLAVGLAFSLVLMAYMGVAGIALAMSFSAAASAAIMLLLFCRIGDVAWVDLLFIAANWMLFLSAMVSLHYTSYAGAVAAAFAFLILLLGEWTEFFASVRR